MTNKEKFLLELKLKRDLIVQTYGSFLDKQARLSHTTKLIGLKRSEEIATRRNILMLDDITLFAIAGRRLFDLCKLQSFGDNLKITQVALENGLDNPKLVYRNDEKIGLYSLLSRIIHMNDFRHYDSKTEFRFFMSTTVDLLARYNEIVSPVRVDDEIEGFLMLTESKYGAVCVKLVDVINCSIDAADKLVEVCSSADISLEAWEREI